LERLSIVIPNVLTIWLRNSSDPTSCHGRTASYLTVPAQIPACGTTALGSSEILASVKDKLVIVFFAIPCSEVCISMQYGMRGWLDLTLQGLSPCKKYRASWRSSAKGH